MKTTEKVHELLLNYACNAKCAFCYNPPITQELLFRELSLSEAAESLYRAFQQGSTRLNLHGGEATLRDDLPNIAVLARRIGFSHVTLVTNGVRLSDSSYARKLAACGIDEFRFSLHGSTAELHDKILRLPGAFDKALAGIKNVREAGIERVGVNFVIHQENFKDMPNALRFYLTALGIRDFIAYYPHYRGMAGLNAESIGVSYPEVAPFVREAFQVLEKNGGAEALYLANFPPCIAPERLERLLDWSRDDAAGHSLSIPDERTREIGEMKHGQRMKAPACGRCSLDQACSGFEREYRQLYGDEHFLPLAARP